MNTAPIKTVKPIKVALEETTEILILKSLVELIQMIDQIKNTLYDISSDISKLSDKFATPGN